MDFPIGAWVAGEPLSRLLIVRETLGLRCPTRAFVALDGDGVDHCMGVGAAACVKWLEGTPRAAQMMTAEGGSKNLACSIGGIFRGLAMMPRLGL
jgi:hypothetical protein